MSSTIGQTLRRIRKARGKSLAVVAGLTGISTSYLSRLETGDRALDSRSLIVALANALEVAPSELIDLPVPAPGDGNTNGAAQKLRVALMSVSRGLPGGRVATLDELRDRAHTVERANYEQRGVLLPDLVRDLHTTLAAGHGVHDLLDLAVMLHAQTVRGWLYVVGAPLDLRWQAATLARQAAEDLADPSALSVVAWASVVEMLASGAFGLAQAELDAAEVPTDTGEGLQLTGMLTLSHALVAAADKRPGDIAAPLDHASDIARRTGQGNAYRMGFGPINVGLWRMASALEAGDADAAIRVAQSLRPEEHPSRERQATYWMDYGRALARTHRRDEAVQALRKAESLHPLRVLRNPFARDTLAGLLARAKRDAVGRELRGMAHRAGLDV